MSEYSIEHSLVFNTAKRVLRFIAPEFRVIARDDIDTQQCRIDLKTNILEVPEGNDFKAAGMIIFNAGILRLRHEDGFYTVFGKIDSSMPDQAIIERIAREHFDADQKAYGWALNTMLAYFPELSEQDAASLIDHRMSYDEWLRYFS